MMTLSIPAIRKLCDSSFYWFVKIIGGACGAGGDITWHVHKPLCDFFQDSTIKRKAIFMPRDWLKTTIFTKWGNIWLYLQDSETRNLISSANEMIAARFLHFIERQFAGNPLLRKVYPELSRVDEAWTRTSRWSNNYCDLPRKGEYSESTITSIGVGGAAQSGHYSHIFIDDPVGLKQMDSPIEMERIYRWQDNTPELLVNPNWRSPQGSIVTIVCTFWGPGDYGTYVMEKYPEYEWRIVPALKDHNLRDTDNVKWIQHPDAGQMETNWPDSPDNRFSTEHYVSMMANPEEERKFWAQHMNNPQRSELTKFEFGWLRWYRIDDRSDGKWAVCLKDDNSDGREFKLSDIPRYGMIDPGGFAETKLQKRGSRNAILVGGQPHNATEKFVFHAWAGRLKEPETFLNEVWRAHDLWSPRAWKIETVGAQEYIKRDLQESARKRKRHLPLSSMEPNVSKNAKDDDIQALIDPAFSGEIYLHRSMKDLIAEYKTYPNGLTMDLLDMLGKINKFYWSRRPKSDIWRMFSEDQTIRRPNPITGY